MFQNVEMTVLIDNLAPAPLDGEWGLSILISADDRRILLDTGAGELFAQNAGRLGIDLAEVDTGVLSHAHFDHADGLEAFFAINAAAPFFLRAGTCENCCSLKEGQLTYIGIRRGLLAEYAPRIRYVSGVHRLGEGLWLIPHREADYASIARRDALYILRDGVRCPDDFSHEQSLVLETPAGLVVFNSCSHTGMINVLADIREALGPRDVCAYVGGLHLFRLGEEALAAACAEIERAPVGRILTGHCTGDHAFAVLKAALGERIGQFSSGFTCRLA